MLAVAGELETGTTTVGYRVQLDHLAPTAVGGQRPGRGHARGRRGPAAHVPGVGQRRARARRGRADHPGRRRARALPREGRRGSADGPTTCPRPAGRPPPTPARAPAPDPAPPPPPPPAAASPPPPPPPSARRPCRRRLASCRCAAPAPARRAHRRAGGVVVSRSRARCCSCTHRSSRRSTPPTTSCDDLADGDVRGRVRPALRGGPGRRLSDARSSDRRRATLPR